MANPNEKNTIPAAASKNTFAETGPSDNKKKAAAPLGSTAVNAHRIQGSEIPVVLIAQKCYTSVAEFEDGESDLEYNILYCPTTGERMKAPSSPGQTGTGLTESPQRKRYKDELQARGGAPPTFEDHGKAAERDAPAANFKFPFDLNKSPPRDDDDDGDGEVDDGTGDIEPGLVA